MGERNESTDALSGESDESRLRRLAGMRASLVSDAEANQTRICDTRAAADRASDAILTAHKDIQALQAAKQEEVDRLLNEIKVAQASFASTTEKLAAERQQCVDGEVQL